jgi:integrase
VQVKGSGGEEQKEAALPTETAAAVSAWLEVAPQSQWVFPARRGRGHIDLSTINKAVTRRAKEVGAVHVHPHRFRAAFITSAFDRGSHWRDIQASVHHEDPRSTQRYDRGQRGGGVAEAVMEYRNKKKAGKGKTKKER